MDATGYEPLRRFEPGWVLAGLAWGTFLGIVAATAPMVFISLTYAGVPDLDDTLTVPLLWVLFFGVTGAMYGGIAGVALGVVVMLAVGRDPEVRAARRTPATIALLVLPLVLLALLWLSA